MGLKYSIFNLELALKDENDNNVYAFVNVSHVPTKKLIEIFEIDLEEDPYILEAHFLTEASFRKHQDYIQKNTGSINLSIFEYSLMRYSTDSFEEIRKMYKEDFME